MGLKRVLGAGDAAWLVAGNMVGAGIFITPGFVAGHLPGVLPPLGAWLAGGLLALCGAAVYAELGARIPRAGGDYQYLTGAFGPLWGFLTGWAAWVLSFSAAAAAMCKVSLEYGATSLALDEPAARWLIRIGAPLLVLALTASNAVGARFAGRTVALLTAAPLLLLVLLFLAGLLVSPSVPQGFREPWGAGDAAWPLALGAALIPVFFTYSGWNAAAYVAGELRDPGRDLARGLLLGTGCVILLYVAVNLVLLAVLGRELAGSATPVATALRHLLGPAAERLLSAGIAVAILGSANVTLMAGSRIYYAMALDGLAPRALARANAAGVPSTALWSAGAWAALLAATAGVEELVSWATLAILLLSCLTVAALVVLRRREPAATFRCPLYPLTPLLYLVTCLAVAAASAIHDPARSAGGLLLVLAGIPLYFVARRLGQRSAR